MKKISAVLLVMVLVGSVAFAGFTGSATAGFGYNLDTQDYGFIGSGTSVTVDLNFLSAAGEAKTSGDIYVDIAASLDFTFSNGDAGDLAVTELTDTTELIAALDFDHAKVVGDGWYVGILGALDAPNFATSTIDSEDQADGPNALGYALDDATNYADVQPSTTVATGASGIELGYAGYTVSFALSGNTGTQAHDVFGTIATPEFTLGDGLTAKLGAAASIINGNSAASGSISIAYASDTASGSVAADLIYDGGLLADVAANVTYDAYSLDMYFATEETYDGTGSGVANYLSAKVSGTVSGFDLSVTGQDLVNTQDLSASVSYGLSDELTLAVSGGYTINGGDWNVGTDVTYTTADFTATAGGSYDKAKEVALNASIESTTVIPGATLSLAWADANDLTKVGADADEELGSITASVEIAF